MPKQWIDLPEDFGTLDVPVPFCNAVRSGDLVYVTGQTWATPGHVGEPKAPAEEQARSAVAEVVRLLGAAGARPADVVRLNSYHVGEHTRLPTTVPQRAAFADGPAFTAMNVPALMMPPYDIEIDAIAVLNARRVHSSFPGGQPFRSAVRAGDLIFVAGRLDTDPQGNLRNPDDPAAQTRAILADVAAILDELGGGLRDVVKTNVYLADAADWAATAQVRSELLGHGVATTDVVADGLPLPGARIQIEAVAAVDTPVTVADPPGVVTWPEPTAFHAGVRAGRLVFVSGQVALGPGGAALHPGDMTAQTRVGMERMRAVLGELGATTDDVLRKNTYYVGLDPKAWVEAAPIRAEYFTKGPCATGVGAPALVAPGLRICMEATAMVES